ncbi:MAG: galactose-1-phosphate uridylyltransferase [Armatimonadetes bacterium]|nr:galactose-1-phosphate uridylyltransferase [Armatimonadota bacterium]
MSELRWHPILEEWVITATHRQDRTFFPPPDYNPLAPTKPGGFPTEIPAPDYDIVVFENKFPSLRRDPPAPAVEGTELMPVRPADGVCEVVVYTPQADATLAELPLDKIEHLIWVWTDRFAELGARPEVEYVFIFENKGREIGVTLAHPHGQIYAYPFIPPKLQTELNAAKKHWDKTGRNLFLDVLQQELEDGRRVVVQNDSFVATVPFFARYPYEVHITARRPGASALTDMDRKEQRDLATILKTILGKYDNLFGFSLPYMMVLHQRPTTGGADEFPHYQFHIEFYPPYRTKDKLKYLAGSESGAGAYINDTLAEEKAAELRALEPQSA